MYVCIFHVWVYKRTVRTYIYCMCSYICAYVHTYLCKCCWYVCTYVVFVLCTYLYPDVYCYCMYICLYAQYLLFVILFVFLNVLQYAVIISNTQIQSIHLSKFIISSYVLHIITCIDQCD